ncbi:type II and III secretion system protein family protein [soil metagenome]
MTKRPSSRPVGWSLALALAVAGSTAAPLGAPAQTVSGAPASTIQVSTGRGKLITLPSPMSDLFVANPAVADVQVRSATQLYVFGKSGGETTLYATSKSGKVIYSATVRVGDNIDTVGQMLSLAMPEAHIVATPMNGMVLLTGTVAAPDDAAEAERLVQAFVGTGTKVISRLKTATPLQVNLQVRIAEVSRTFAKNIGSNLASRDQTNGFQFGISSGRSPGTIGNVDTSSYPQLDASSLYGFPAGTLSLPFDVKTGNFVYPNSGTANTFTSGATRTAIGLAGKLFGLDLLGALDLGETMGQVTTLSNPNLTALSGETASFLAGGEIPIAVAQGLGQVSIEYKQYGVSLSYTPTVLSDGRISLRVRPEVSQLGTPVSIGGNITYPLSTRRVETTVELGSGQSFMIAGLLSNNHTNSIDKTPGVGDLPVLGALFRSNGFQRNETELVIVVTPYLVKPVNANDIVLPTDGYKAPTDLDRVLLGKLSTGESGGDRPKPTMAPPTTAAPAFGAGSPAPMLPSPMLRSPMPVDDRKALPPKKADPKKGAKPAAPGFSLN